jgi:hypothetical protein
LAQAQWPAPSQAIVPTQELRGSSASLGRGAHAPSEPGTAQDGQPPQAAEEQQTPSTHEPVAHCALTAQNTPMSDNGAAGRFGCSVPESVVAPPAPGSRASAPASSGTVTLPRSTSVDASSGRLGTLPSAEKVRLPLIGSTALMLEADYERRTKGKARLFETRRFRFPHYRLSESRSR